MSRRLLDGSSRVWLVVALLAWGSRRQPRPARRAAVVDEARRGRCPARQQPIRRRDSSFAIRRRARTAPSCHVRDSAGKLQRISYERKTPEGWEMTVRRMVALNNVKLDPAAARTIVRYLSDNQGLAPAELRPGRFEVERRMIEYRYTADPRTETTCRACHSMGRVITQRRTRGEWELLVATHRALFPDADFQAFRRGGPAANDSGAGAPHPMDVGDHSSRARVSAAHAGVDRVVGDDAAAAPRGHVAAERQRAGTRRVLRTHDGHARRGRRRVRHAGDVSLRRRRAGRAPQRTSRSSTPASSGAAGRPIRRCAPRDTVGLREVMFVEPGWEEMSGRWFTGGYDEIGMDVSLTKRRRESGASLGVAPRAVRVGTRGQDVTIFGANLPRTLTRRRDRLRPRRDGRARRARDARFDHGARERRFRRGRRQARPVRRRRVAARRRGGLRPDQPHQGRRRSPGWRASAASCSRSSSSSSTPIAYYNGPDGKPDTDDDLEIGRVNATWALEEYGVTYDDDDVKFVGAHRPDGTVHAERSTVPIRRAARTATTSATSGSWRRTSRPTRARGRSRRARSSIVTVPLYVKFAPWRTQP